MERKDIFTDLGMQEYICGNAFVYSVFDIDLSHEKNRFLMIDEICKTESWNQLGSSWNGMGFSECSELLMDSLEFDIAYSSARITPEEVAKKFHDALLRHVKESDSYCYSNWFNNHWRSNKNGSSWNSLTESTFDLSTVFVTRDKILITCFRSED